jgi:Holliday junction resolvase RusA-like endonuclease
MRSYPITPMPAPRQMRGSRWHIRDGPRIERYHAFRDECRWRRVAIPERPWLRFEMPVPARGADRVGQPHLQRPDFDNLAKAVVDALLREDGHVWDVRITKIWERAGAIVIGDLGSRADCRMLEPWIPQTNAPW